MNSEWDTIRSLHSTFIDWEGDERIGERTYEGIQAWSMLTSVNKPYSGAPQLKQLPCAKKDYGGKNAAGGQKAVFSQAPAYKRRNKRGNTNGYYEKYHWASGVSKVATPWYGWDTRVA